MGLDLGNLSISLDRFNEAASGKYNIGQLKLSKDGTSVYRTNNHKTWTIFNNTKISVTARKRWFGLALADNVGVIRVGSRENHTRITRGSRGDHRGERGPAVPVMQEVAWRSWRDKSWRDYYGDDVRLCGLGALKLPARIVEIDRRVRALQVVRGGRQHLFKLGDLRA